MWWVITTYDCHLSNITRKFGDKVLTINLCCCHLQQAFDAIGSKAREIEATMLLPLETSKVARGNTIILLKSITSSPKLRRALLKWKSK